MKFNNLEKPTLLHVQGKNRTVESFIELTTKREGLSSLEEQTISQRHKPEGLRYNLLLDWNQAACLPEHFKIVSKQNIHKSKQMHQIRTDLPNYTANFFVKQG